MDEVPGRAPQDPTPSGQPAAASAPPPPPSPPGPAPAASGGTPFFSRPGALLGGALVLGLLGGLLGGYLGQLGGSATEPAGVQTSEPSGAPVASGGADAQGFCDAEAVANAVLPSVVTINVVSETGGGVGTGSIIRDDGHILTNNHVVADAVSGARIVVTFSNGQQASASLVGRSQQADIAVIKVEAAETLPTITTGDSDEVAVGQPVVALGAPLGLSGSVTAGIVSALGRDVPVPADDGSTAVLAGAIQTDAAINPGNSGGALVDCDGELIGVNSAIATVPNAAGQTGGGSVGIGFAVPINLAISLAEQLIETGNVSYPYLGMQVVVIPQDVAAQFNTAPGLYVEGVTAGGPAEQAGLQSGDIITALDGEPATSAAVLTKLKLTKKVGDTVEVDYLRGTETGSTTLTLSETP
ncbi:S1C family serine protease [Microterricola viridarii]|uniref:S1C family serine protease n=1 Tax=Microterricola viridarii TaxID=412690 RepID=UPI0018D2DB07|nr:trypsin-like peptidase domain-containing protein [Microterricola viridarii]